MDSPIKPGRDGWYEAIAIAVCTLDQFSRYRMDPLLLSSPSSSLSLSSSPTTILSVSPRDEHDRLPRVGSKINRGCPLGLGFPPNHVAISISPSTLPRLARNTLQTTTSVIPLSLARSRRAHSRSLVRERHVLLIAVAIKYLPNVVRFSYAKRRVVFATMEWQAVLTFDD